MGYNSVSYRTQTCYIEGEEGDDTLFYPQFNEYLANIYYTLYNFLHKIRSLELYNGLS